MKAPITPLDETKRLESLRSLNILDTAAEERFDRFTRMAKRLFDVPIALVSLVDDKRQWFKSCIGLDAMETPRDISFCGHAILGDQPFVITNALKDKRFFDNPLVTEEPSIRFYAGCSICTPDSYKIGTLCIIDRKPREFDEDEQSMLIDLACMVEQELAAINLATSDELTQISNRRGFNYLAEKCLKLCEREEIAASLVFIDLDDFKQINDTFGHDEGDAVLVKFANQLKASFRGSDVIARIGGDEFVIILVNLNKQASDGVLRRFTESIQLMNNEIEQGYKICFSYGVVEYDGGRHTCIDSLLKAGDELMYSAKKARKPANSASKR